MLLPPAGDPGIWTVARQWHEDCRDSGLSYLGYAVNNIIRGFEKLSQPTTPDGAPRLVEVSCWSRNLGSIFILGSEAADAFWPMISSRRTP